LECLKYLELSYISNSKYSRHFSSLQALLFIFTEILSIMLIRIYPENPNPRHIRQVVDLLDVGGIIIYPTDTVYAMGCDIKANKSIDKIARFKGLNPENPDLSLIFHDMSQLSEYTIIRDNTIFKLLKRNLPGPFTFIVRANNQIPKLFKNKKKTVGIRIPDNPIVLELVRELGRPIITTSIHDPDEIIEYITDPELIHEKYREFADIVIDGGYGKNEASTIVDCTGDEPEIIRQGLGILEL
jgi:tRNA threonylcarbamoyl adenosine modification protein (Sua5/YciO/YrdC/YwlC family)